MITKTNSQFSRNVYAISNRIWCNKHLRHKTTEKYDNNGKGGSDMMIIIYSIYSQTITTRYMQIGTIEAKYKEKNNSQSIPL